MLALPRSKPSRRLRSLATMALAILSALGVSAAAVQAFTVPVSGPADAPRIKAHCGCDVTQLLLPNTAHLFMVHRSLASWVDYVVDWLSSRGLGGRRTSTSPLACPKPTGALRGRSLGPLRLGWTRARARRTLRRYGVTYNNMDNFCLAARWGIRAGYPSARLLSKLSDQQRRRVAGKIILLLTANRYYSLGGVRAGRRLGAAARRLHAERPSHIGANYWYIVPGKLRDGLLKVRGGVIEEVGIVDRQLGRGRAAQSRLLTSFKAP